MYRTILREALPGLRPLSAGRSVAAFLFASALVLSALTRVGPAGDGGPMAIKLGHFAQHRDDYEAIFIGSSRVYRGFVPSLFEERLAEAGTPLRTFNMGLLGLRTPEAELVLRRIAELEPANLRYVFVDPEPLDYLFLERNPRARRVIEWHDAGTTLAVCGMIAADEERPWTERAELLGAQGTSLVYHLTNLGGASPWVAELLGQRPTGEMVAEFLGEERDGYRAYHGTYAPADEAEREELEQVAETWDVRVRSLARHRPDPSPLGEAELDFYRRLRDAAAAAGARLVLVSVPSFAPRDDLVRAAAALDLPLLRYDRPQRHPGLYRREHRYRHEHLNDEGARAFTEVFAADCARLLGGKPPAVNLVRRDP